MDFVFFLLTVAAAALGGFLGRKLRLPAGLMVGAMIGAAALNLITEKALFFSDVRTLLQLFSGALVGSRIGRAELKSMRSLFGAGAALLLCMAALDLGVGLSVYALGFADAPTALFGVSPGGSNDMSIIAQDFGGNPGLVAVLQVSRLLMIYFCAPPAIRLLDRRAAKKAAASGKAQVSAPAAAPKTEKKPFCCMLLCAFAGGIALYLLKVSAGAMIGAMLGSAAFCVWKGKQRYPVSIKDILQVLSGAYVGTRLDRATCAGLGQLLPSLCVLLVGLFLCTCLSAYLIRRLSGVDLSTAVLSSTPGGLQEMSLLSEELGADTAKVAALHTTRVIFVILLFPYMIQLVLRLLA